MALSCASLVEYFGSHEEYRCGYCKTPDKNFSNGMWTHSLTPEDYQDLIDRGWRRSGKYCYKPMNDKTCCPAYTISCKALDFRISKSQKKVIKRFRKYLEGHEVNINVKPNKTVSVKPENAVTKNENGSDMSDDDDFGNENITVLVPKAGKIPQSNIEVMDTEHAASALSAQSLPKSEPTSPKTANADKQVDPSNDSVEKRNPSSDVEKKPVKKAKELRLERKKQKLLAKGIDPETVIKKAGAFANQGKSIEELLDFNEETLKRKLVVKTVRVGTPEFKATFDLEASLYKHYQMIIHNDEESECDGKQFKRFLCDSPIKADEDDPTTVFGTHHQQYYIDGELIAVGVIDILPKCVSSVYFFYSPSHMFLTLGTFGALMEIAYSRSLHRRCPSVQFYYMGFYIHSCVKMRYKGNYFPSYLLCPESYTWHLLDDDMRKKLTDVKYCRLKAGPQESETVDVNQVLVLFRHKLMRYSACVKKRGDHEDRDEVTEYARLVGAKCAERMLLFRS